MIIEFLKNKIFIKKINNNYLIINQNNGAWFILNEKNKNILINYLNNKKKISTADFKKIKKILITTKFLDIIKPSSEYKQVIKKYSSIVISVTKKCNLKCNYCWANADNNADEDINFEIIRCFVNKILYKKYCGDYVRFEFSGGEPSLKLDLIKESVQYIKNLSKKRKIKIFFHLQTNAISISEEIVKVIKKYNFSIGVSVDRVDKGETGRIFANGKKSTFYTLKNIKKLVSYNIKPAILTTISKYNAREIYKIPIFMKKLGLNNIRILPLIIGRERKNTYKSIKAESKIVFESVKKLIDVIYNINLNNKNKQENIYDFHISQIIRKIMYDQEIFYPCAQSPCGSGRQILSLFPNGDVFPCDGFSRYRLFKCGNILKDSMDMIRNSRPIKELNKRNVKKIKKCKNCAYNNYCSGGCIQDIIIKNKNYKEILSPTPYCNYYYNLIFYLFKMIDEKKDLKLLLPPSLY